MKRELIITSDGSTTLFVPELNEHYHSTHGAIQESMHVFIEAGLKQITNEKIKIFELGFGTGLNCLLTFLNKFEKQIVYHAIEPFPMEPLEVKQLNFPELLKLTKANFEIFELLHNSPWNKETNIATNFTLKKNKETAETYKVENGYNIIYFDAFAPAIHPHLWTLDIFGKMYAMLSPDGILVTYCAKGEVRRTLQSCGFKVERLPGPPGKREILRAVK